MPETGKKTKTASKPRKAAEAKAPDTKAQKTRTVKANTAEAKPVLVTHDQIAQLAHRYWAERGYQHGHAEVDWLRAEQELRGKAS